MAEITKILIANRGEIACRVIRTARKMGIGTVAVYSDADRKALHVRMADEAVHIGPSPAVESYLVIEKIIAAAKDTGTDAVHPGYGFLSENPHFVRACAKANITFIGPSAEAMEAMGLKDAAKKLMDDAGVPITPGYHGKDQSLKLLKAKAGMIGYPVLIKAVAGGGGKGMRKVEADADFDAALASCKREAASSFGNDDVLIEKYIQSPRHIEVQVFGDTHGNIVHLFERDCSLQRRHQKVIEEAPAPGMTDAVRKAMTDAAIKAAKAVDYVGAGTVEFIVDGSGKLRTDGFWFMEMNTRLQVEHPVTEEITGLDLVEWQIRVARGEALPKQGAITMEGHAIEARIYAEDPANDFLPSVGQIRHIDLTTEIDSDMRSRVDTSVEEGDIVSIFYDPMIAKAIVWSESREYTSGLLQNFISDIEATGVTTNAGFVTRCLNHPAFLSADISTHFIEQYSEALQSPDYLNRDEIYAIAARTLRNKDIADDEPFSDLSGWRLNNTRPMIYRFAGPSGEMVVELNVSTQQDVTAHVNGRFVRLSLDDEVQSHSNEEALSYEYAWSTIVKPEYVSLRRASETIIVPRYIAGGDGVTITSDFLTAPMPGKIIALNCAPGDTVKFGDPLVIMEAMKMEQTLSATRDGIVAEVGAAVGDLVTDGALLVRLVEEET